MCRPMVPACIFNRVLEGVSHIFDTQKVAESRNCDGLPMYMSLWYSMYNSASAPLFFPPEDYELLDINYTKGFV